MKRHILYIIGACSLLSGCNLYKNYERPEGLAEVEGLYRDTLTNDGVLSAADTANFGCMPWREVFTDPQLQGLIEKALVNNIDMKKADFNIQKVEAALKIAKLAYIPAIAFAPQGTVSSFDFGKASQTYTIPLSVNWNLGSMGSLRNHKKQAQVSLLQMHAVKQATQTAIISGVANMYYTLEMLDEQLKTTESTLVIWKRNVEVMEAMKEAGMVNEAAVGQARANYIELQASVPQLKNSVREVENALCVLLDEAPHAIERGSLSANHFPEQLSAGVPMQLLTNRPDVRVAEYALASQFYGVNIARSAFYPSLNITGTGALVNNAGGMVFNPGKIIASAVASVVQPIFANGQLRAQLKIAKLDYEAAELDFRERLLIAGQEVSNALSSYSTANQSLQLREQEVRQLEQTLENVNALFLHSNTTTYLETLTAQQSLLSAQLKLINDRYTRLQAGINLYKALGGGRE